MTASSTPLNFPRVSLDGVPFAAATESEVVAAVAAELGSGRGGWLVPMNVDVLLRWRRDPSIQDLCSEADVFLADGMPLLWAASLQGTPLPERVAGSTLIVSLCAAAARAERSVYLLGGDPGMADQAAVALAERCPGLRIAGTYCPPMGFEKNPVESERIREAVAAARPDLIFVGLGFPKQERLIRSLRSAVPSAWWMGVGISFSFLAGRVHRAPTWVQAAGLEWVHRMAQEPGRLARRYLIDDVPFALGLMARSARARLQP